MVFDLIRKKFPKLFLSRVETQILSDRIDVFESQTGCELVFHFRKHLGDEPLKQTEKLFHHFNLHKTEHHAAILIVLALRDQKFAVWADEKVHRHAGDVLWQSVCKIMSEQLKAGNRLDALLEAMDVAEKTLAREQPDESKKIKKTLSNIPITEEE